MSTPSPREQFLVISALGDSPIGLASSLTRACDEHRCAITNMRLSCHGQSTAVTLQVAGNWDTLARLESMLPHIAKRQNFTFNLVRSQEKTERPQSLPYIAYVSAVYRPDILNELCQFFFDHQIELDSVASETHKVPQTGGDMINATFTLTLPPGTQISWLRDQFLDFADALNLDALLEPWRPQPI